ncbi:hypothetical protein [Brevundimonas sp.]|uniref:hypothetical protein n=1 Tax=Brevundimonas sp. TaxID=1871086 RepID=UPI002D5FD02A|nr:hypothetical protein [Brevundimonas sp.]HYC73214.1 hypothetical protein [Brevundimonas sp.]
MRRFVLQAAATAFLFGTLMPGSACGQVPVLSAVDAEGQMAPLTVDQLDPEERAIFETLAPDSADARRFLYTRGFLRHARQVVDGQLTPILLPDLPAEENWDRRFFSQKEADDVIDAALTMHMAATLSGTEALRPRPVPVIADPYDRLPDIRADGMIEPLRVDQLDPDERATYATLAPDSADARKFLYSRGYLRFCRLVVAGDLPALDLPDLPERENWDRRFFSEYEATELVDVALGQHLIALLQPAT